MERTIETRQAIIHVVAPGRLEVRFRSDQIIDPEGLREVLQAREGISTTEGPQAVLAVFPGDVRFEMPVMTQDHYKDRSVVTHTRLVAVVATGLMQERLATLYFTYFPQPFPTAVFSSEVEAQAWIQSQLGGPGAG